MRLRRAGWWDRWVGVGGRPGEYTSRSDPRRQCVCRRTFYVKARNNSQRRSTSGGAGAGGMRSRCGNRGVMCGGVVWLQGRRKGAQSRGRVRCLRRFILLPQLRWSLFCDFMQHEEGGRRGSRRKMPGNTQICVLLSAGVHGFVYRTICAFWFLVLFAFVGSGCGAGMDRGIYTVHAPTGDSCVLFRVGGTLAWPWGEDRLVPGPGDARRRCCVERWLSRGRRYYHWFLFFRVERVGVRDSAGLRAPAVTAAATAVWSVSPRLIWLVMSAATRRRTDVTSAEDGR